MSFKITHKDKKTSARTGILTVRGKKVNTPFFMPVATKAAVKYLSSKDLQDIDANAVISNTFVLHTKPGEKIVKKLGGIKKYMNYHGINVTDSGGFQMYSPSIYIKSNSKGVWFRNPFSGEKLHITPEKDMEIQLDINSDIAMCLDTMPLIEHTKKAVELAVNQTYDWAKRCKTHHDKKQKLIPKNKRQMLFGICQGGIHKDLRKISAAQISSINFDGLAIGGLALGEKKQDELKMVKVAKSVYPEDKICYLMGEGNPVMLLEAIALGCDMFDSRFPTQNARRGTIFTSKGRLRIFNAKYKTDKKPIEKDCNCYACKNFCRGYIRTLLMDEEPMGRHLASLHNLHYLQELMKQAQNTIKQNKFSQLLNKIKKVYQ